MPQCGFMAKRLLGGGGGGGPAVPHPHKGQTKEGTGFSCTKREVRHGGWGGRGHILRGIRG